MDFAWDTLQLGYQLTRQHGRLYHPELHKIVMRGIATFPEQFSDRVHLLAIPAARFFRVCDLLSGCDIPTVVRQVNAALQYSKGLKQGDGVPLGKFVISVREPIHLHPAFRLRMRGEGRGLTLGFEVDAHGQFDLFDWQRQLKEFQYQYALYRTRNPGDWIGRGLLQAFLQVEHDGGLSEEGDLRLDSFLPRLTGLHAWDLHKKQGKTQEEAFIEASKLYPDGGANGGLDNARVNYRKAARRIEGEVVRIQAGGRRIALSQIKKAMRRGSV